MPRSAHVLYIDDDTAFCGLTQQALQSLGYSVETVPSGPEGVARAAASPFDVIVVDHDMPGQDGLATIGQLLALPAPSPIVYVAGSDESRLAVAALKAGAADYVTKAAGEDFIPLLDNALLQALAKSRLEAAKLLAEQNLLRTNARLEALLREVNHRVANSLQLVSALVHMQSAALPDKAAKAALEDTERRIQAIAQIHRRLYTGEAVDRVAMDDYLAALLTELEETWSTPNAPRRLKLCSEPIRMPTDRAVSLGVIVNELVSNACKYAYAPNMPGEVRIVLTHDGEGRFLLRVEDDGRGMKKGEPPRGTGLGTKVIRAMARSLEATLRYDLSHQGVKAILNGVLSG